MDDRFLQSLFTRRHCVLGKRLQPFSLAHRVTLSAIESPLLSSNTPVNFTQLALAVSVCSQKNPFVRFSKVSVCDQLRYRYSKLNPRYFYREADKFIAYLEDSCSHPKILSNDENDDGEKPYSLPWCLQVIAVLMRNGNLTENSAWSLPEGRALWLYTAFVNLEGAKLKVISTEEEAKTRSKFAEWERLEKRHQNPIKP